LPIHKPILTNMKSTTILPKASYTTLGTPEEEGDEAQDVLGIGLYDRARSKGRVFFPRVLGSSLYSVQDYTLSSQIREKTREKSCVSCLPFSH
jgi:hypothetical protein